jgi:hypothetical protein
MILMAACIIFVRVDRGIGSILQFGSRIDDVNWVQHICLPKKNETLRDNVKER